MRYNIRSIIFTGVLLAVLLFLVGFRLGKKVEFIDKTYVPPTPTATIVPPTPTDFPSTIEQYQSKGCALSFLYPPQLEIEESSQEAQLKKGKESIFVSCKKETVAKLQKELNESKGSKSVASVQNQNINIYSDSKFSSWIIINSKTGSKIVFKVTRNLSDLVLKTLEFTK